MKIIAIERELPGATVGQFQPHLTEEALAVWHLHQADSVRELYFRADQNTAVLILECEDTTEAEAMLASLPLVKEGLISFDLLPLRPYPGFVRLFSQEIRQDTE